MMPIPTICYYCREQMEAGDAHYHEGHYSHKKCLPTGQETVHCEMCGGSGVIEVNAVVGYVMRDMATDACCPEMEGEEVWGSEAVECGSCNGSGLVLKDGTI